MFWNKHIFTHLLFGWKYIRWSKGCLIWDQPRPKNVRVTWKFSTDKNQGARPCLLSTKIIQNNSFQSFNVIVSKVTETLISESSVRWSTRRRRRMPQLATNNIFYLMQIFSFATRNVFCCKYFCIEKI